MLLKTCEFNHFYYFLAKSIFLAFHEIADSFNSTKFSVELERGIQLGVLPRYPGCDLELLTLLCCFRLH